MSYVYHSLYAYFSRDNVALPGVAAFFKKARHPACSVLVCARMPVFNSVPLPLRWPCAGHMCHRGSDGTLARSNQGSVVAQHSFHAF